VVHVDLNELEGLVLDHLDSLGVEVLAEVSEMLAGDAFSLPSTVEGLL
jgi:hypothetical protein